MKPVSLIEGLELPEPAESAAPVELQVVRHPHDLANHLRRVEASTTTDGVYGALVDLFIGTPADDQATRVRALNDHRHHLTEEQYDALRVAAARGLEPASPIPPARRSLLTSGATRSVPLVVAPAPVGASAAASASVASMLGTPDPAPVTPAAEPNLLDERPAVAPTPAAVAPGAVRPEIAEPSVAPASRRPVWAWAAAAAVALVLLGIGGFLLSRPADTTATSPTTAAAPTTVATTAASPTTSGPAPTTVATTPAPTTGAPSTTAVAATAPDPAASAAVRDRFAALGDPAAADRTDLYAPGSETAAALAAFRRQLVAGDARLVTQAPVVESVTVAGTGSNRTATVEVSHRGAVLVTPAGSVAWAAPGTARFVVDLVDRDGQWQVTTITRR